MLFDKVTKDEHTDADGIKTEWYYLTDGRLHREYGPAKIKYDIFGRIILEEYHQRGKLHRNDDQPAVIEYDENYGIKCLVWYQYGKKDRHGLYKDVDKGFKPAFMQAGYENCRTYEIKEDENGEYYIIRISDWDTESEEIVKHEDIDGILEKWIDGRRNGMTSTNGRPNDIDRCIRDGRIVDHRVGYDEKNHKLVYTYLEHVHGQRYWYDLNGELHRKNGPAIEDHPIRKNCEWYWHGTHYETMREYIRETPNCGILTRWNFFRFWLTKQWRTSWLYQRGWKIYWGINKFGIKVLDKKKQLVCWFLVICLMIGLGAMVWNMAIASIWQVVLWPFLKMVWNFILWPLIGLII